jgi:putative MFS transporter
MICLVFMSLWAWRQSAARVSKQAYNYSRASQDEMLRGFAKLPLHWRHISIYACAIMSYAGCGAVNDTIGLAFTSLQEEWGLQTPSRLACLSLACTAGQILASIFAGHYADNKGRCFTIRYASLLILLCFWCSASAPSLEVLAVARFFAGFGFGALNVAIPTLLSECLPKHARSLLVLYQFGWPLGAATYTFTMSAIGWRAANFAALPCASLIFVVFWCPGCIPESPSWLCSRGRLQEAADSVYQYGGTTPQGNAETTQAKVEGEAEGVQKEIGTDESKPAHSQHVYMAFAMLCVASASMLIKIWLPSLLALRNVPSESTAFVNMWILEAVAIVISGILFGSPGDSTRSDNLVLLRVAQVSYIIAASSVLGYTKVTASWLITLLGGAHLLGQANVSNFLMAFATLSFPVAVRARCIGVIFLAQYVGGLVGPLLGSLLLEFAPGLGACGVLLVASLIYTCGYLSTLPLSYQTPVS